MEQSGFYRVDQDGLFHFARLWVYGPGYHLERELKDTYTYPTEGGWMWFDTKAEAIAYFGLPEDTLYFGEEE